MNEKDDIPYYTLTSNLDFQCLLVKAGGYTLSINQSIIHFLLTKSILS